MLSPLCPTLPYLPEGDPIPPPPERPPVEIVLRIVHVEISTPAAPEPATLMILAPAAAALLLKRRIRR